jgi:hypothetical protein
MVTTGGKIVTMDMRPAIATHNRCPPGSQISQIMLEGDAYGGRTIAR